MALYSVNSYTTTDANRVNAAYNVASTYFIKNGVAGAWQNTLGVYDRRRHRQTIPTSIHRRRRADRHQWRRIQTA
jgi:hypothetical protein